MKKTVLAVLGVLLACAPLTQISVAQKRSQNQPQKQQQMQWREYVYPQDGFAISWPSAPTPHYDGGDRHINVYTVAMGKTVVSLRAISRLMDCETALSEMWDKAEGGKNSNEPIIKGSLKQVSPAGMKGLEYETEMGSGQRSLHRFQCADEHRFYIFNVGYAGKQRPPEADRIIKSFHVVSPAH
ncbi:MAG: hypothetical protein JWN42_43 [Candidatus Angelobacter sp.]|nr:hypothetical protein [Candidatus Angelobacter sp.]